MDKSKRFRLFFLASILFLVIGVVLNVTFPFTSCGYYSYYNYSCSYFYSQYYYECTANYGSTYCCTYSYSYCGDYSSCVYKPYIPATYYNNYPCTGFLIASFFCYALTFICAIVVFVLFRNLRAKAREGAYLGLNQSIGGGIVPFAPSNPVVPISNNTIVYTQNRSYEPPSPINNS